VQAEQRHASPCSERHLESCVRLLPMVNDMCDCKVSRGAVEVFARLRYCVASVGSFLPTFRRGVSVLFSRIQCLR
jgi:hypothetical protein